ncbi:MAG: class I SAM-dependent methyltransferase [Bacteroidota bacterium]
MSSLQQKIVRRFRSLFGLHTPIISHGEKGIKEVGHRRYVGGMWEEIGKLQFDFLVDQGMKPEHVFLDVACGSLRAGVHVIPYLNAGNYQGIDKEASLIEQGIKEELGETLNVEKQPEFVVSDAFEFERFSKPADYAIAQSLFTHLPPAIIHQCFQKLRPAFSPEGSFYATYFLPRKGSVNPKKAHDHGIFRYTKEEIIAFGTDNGWQADFIGDWNHPRNQIIVRYFIN